MRRILLYLVSVLADAVAFLVVCCVMRFLWGKRVVFKRGVAWMELNSKSWFYQKFYADWGATTFGHVVLVSADHLMWVDHPDALVQPLRRSALANLTDPLAHDIAVTAQLAEHELIHVEAYEAIMLLLAAINGVLFAFAGTPWWMCLVLQTVGGVGSFLAANATAWLRGEHPYLGSHLEEAARAQVTCGRNPKLMAEARLE